LHFGANLSSWRRIGTSRHRGALFIARISAVYGEPDAPGGRNRLDEQETTRRMQIIVRDNNVDQALRALKKKLQREGVYREMKLRRHYEKPSEKRARERAAAVRRARKMERKRMERDGIK
jgi:small subunit ribosomal protein S21